VITSHYYDIACDHISLTGHHTLDLDDNLDDVSEDDHDDVLGNLIGRMENMTIQNIQCTACGEWYITLCCVITNHLNRPFVIIKVSAIPD
jgi:hypothetical protein